MTTDLKPPSFHSFLKEELQELRKQDLYRKLKVLEDRGPAKVFYQGRELVLFCGNDYLGLSHHPKMIETLRRSAQTQGVGAGAARLISGTSPAHAELEKKLAQFKNKESALVYTAGYLANLGVLTSLCGAKDLIVMDKLCHASLIDGARLSGAEIRVFPHKNYERCREILEKAEGFQKKFLVSDTVFSMDGDFAEISTLIEIKKKYNAVLILDDAHGVGVMGETGRGAAEGFENEIDVITGTLSKAVGAVGGFAAADALVTEYLINTSRPFIFATALPPAICAAASSALDIMETDPGPRQKLWHNVREFRKGLQALGVRLPEQESPILPLLIGQEKQALEISEGLLKEGFLVPAVRTPAVPKGKARLRITLSAAHDASQIERILQLLSRIAKPFLVQNPQ